MPKVHLWRIEDPPFCFGGAGLAQFVPASLMVFRKDEGQYLSGCHFIINAGKRRDFADG